MKLSQSKQYCAAHLLTSYTPNNVKYTPLIMHYRCCYCCYHRLCTLSLLYFLKIFQLFGYPVAIM